MPAINSRIGTLFPSVKSVSFSFPVSKPGLRLWLLLWIGFWNSFPAAASTNSLVPLRVVEGVDGAFSEASVVRTNGQFRAVTGRPWPTGLMPVFVVSREAGNQLRRTPPAGLEADAEPAFFALPAADEPESSSVSGHWEVRAVRGDGSRLRFGLDLGAVRGRMAARFDPDTDYRFARIPSGTFRTNALSLEVLHIQDRFELTAELAGGRLDGRWRHEDGSEEGHWTAERAVAPEPVNPSALTDLVGWLGPKGVRTWRPREAGPGEGWRVDGPVLCRVWRTE